MFSTTTLKINRLYFQQVPPISREGLQGEFDVNKTQQIRFIIHCLFQRPCLFVSSLRVFVPSRQISPLNFSLRLCVSAVKGNNFPRVYTANSNQFYQSSIKCRRYFDRTNNTEVIVSSVFNDNNQNNSTLFPNKSLSSLERSIDSDFVENYRVSSNNSYPHVFSFPFVSWCLRGK